MLELGKASARAQIEVANEAEVARAVRGDLVSAASLDDDLEGGPLILDGARRRPRYFDGRFLTGADLTRDQDYVRQRQSDMARAGGTGVIRGLGVVAAASVRGQSVRIEPGLGLTPSGDLVMLSQRRDLPILDMPVTRELDAAMGLSARPRVPLGRRTGLFILALRPVEFTANPIAAYPRSITGQRTVEDGDIIEATAITLIPYPDHSGAATLAQARRAVARQIFLSGAQGLPQDALPLALLGIERGTIRWIDGAMVRREIGRDGGVEVSMGARPRALAEAHVIQHRAHLGDVLDDLRGRAPIFPAASVFSALPPAGQLPAATIQPDSFGFRQFYFPPSLDVDIAFVPIDEIPALVEESLALPPIDLQADAAEIDATGVLILVPVTRARFQRFQNALPRLRTPATADPASRGGKPALDMLTALLAKRAKLDEAAVRDAAAEAQARAEQLTTAAWHAAFQEAAAALPRENGRPPLLWYTRRRSIAYRTAASGAVAIAGDDVVIAGLVTETLRRLGLTRRFAAVNARATAVASARIMALLGNRAVSGSDILTASVIADLEAVIRSIPTRADLPKTRLPIETLEPAKGVLERPVLLDPTVLKGAVAGREAVPTLRANAAAAGLAQTASVDLAAARAELNRTLAAEIVAMPTSSDVVLGDGEVMDLAQDYSDPRLGDGLARLQAQAGSDWPGPKQATWLGDSQRALVLDSAFRTLPARQLPTLAAEVARAVSAQDVAAIDSALAAAAAPAQS